MNNASLHESISRQPLRPMPIALAHCLVSARPGTLREETLRILYRRLTPADQVRCRVEMLECSQAKRGLRKAEVVI